ncbi:MAG: hypothetical protein GF417_10340 [Candidatus Latescibacteria bacterium]|nr:hypothetical protein [bacterium]MBD3424826.1 hypothetical protein [Candidatus Latescibacterota bacterium]
MRKTVLSSILSAALIVMLLCPQVLAGEGTRYHFKFHGFFKTDISYDNAQIYPGNYHLYVPPYGEADNALYFTTRESRLGFDFLWKEDCLKTQATLEFDFYGSGAGAENKAGPMLRHAYLKMTGKNWSLLAGQTWDVISPLVPKTVNYSVAWGEGNIGYRRPQVRFSTWAGIGERAKFTLDVAMTRNMGGDFGIAYNDTISVTAGDGVDNGADAALPAIQGRIGIASDFSEEGMLAVGISGHYGQEKFDRQDMTDPVIRVTEESIDSWSVNGDLTLKINRYLSLKGEFFTGQALGTYLGGALQNTDGIYQPLPTMGGWGMLSLMPTDRLTFNAGYSFDDPDDAEYDIPKGGSERFRDMNSLVFGNAMYGITDNVTGMLEFSYLKTEYLTKTYIGDSIESTPGENDCFRVQFALKAAIR